MLGHIWLAMTEDETRISDSALAFARANKKVIARQLADPLAYPPEACPVSLFMAGSPGAGKTETSKALIEEIGGAVLRIDPDDLREKFSEYSGANAWLFQAATSVLVDRILDVALKQGQSYLLDGTLTHYEKARQNVERSIHKHRTVQILYVYQEPRQAWAFVRAREMLEGRHIGLDTFVKQYFEARKVVNRLKKEFGRDVRVDLLIKNIDGSNRWAKANVDQIDNHIPEKYDSEALFQLLRPQVTT